MPFNYTANIPESLLRVNIEQEGWIARLEAKSTTTCGVCPIEGEAYIINTCPASHSVQVVSKEQFDHWILHQGYWSQAHSGLIRLTGSGQPWATDARFQLVLDVFEQIRLRDDLPPAYWIHPSWIREFNWLRKASNETQAALQAAYEVTFGPGL